MSKKEIRVLVVDDMTAERTRIGALLSQSQKYEVDFYGCPGSESAVIALMTREFDCVFMDEILDTLRGTDVVAWMRDRYLKLPVTMVTGFPTEQSLQRIESLDAGILPKDRLTTASLDEALDRMVGS